MSEELKPCRSKTLEVMARELFQRFRIEEADAPSVTWEEHAIHAHHHAAYVAAASAALTAYESHLQAEGMAVVPASALVDARANALKDAADAVDKELENGSPEHTWDNEEQVYDLARARAINAINDLPASPYGKAVVQEKDA